MLPIEIKEGICLAINPHRFTGECPDFLSREATEPVRHFHESLEQYAPTPLVSLPGLAARLGIAGIFVKDESRRFGLNAFKGLGGSYALAKVICEELGIDPKTVTMQELQRPENRKRIEKMVFITTTDGNHGKGISWAAGLLGAKS